MNYFILKLIISRINFTKIEPYTLITITNQTEKKNGNFTQKKKSLKNKEKGLNPASGRRKGGLNSRS